MLDVEKRLDAAAQCARRADWPGYAAAFGAVRDALVRHPAYTEDEALRRHLDTLGAAAPQHDPEGCIGEIAALVRVLRERHAAQVVPLPAPASAAPIDLRGLQPPEPIWRILDALERAPRTPLRVILPHEPQPLYNLLRERGYEWSGEARPDGGYELLIRRI